MKTKFLEKENKIDMVQDNFLDKFDSAVDNSLDNADITKENKNSLFSGEEDGYYFYASGKKVIRVTDFLLKNVIISDDYIKADTTKNGHCKKLDCSISSLYNSRNIKNSCIGAFIGNPKYIPLFWSWVQDEYKDNYMETVSYYGIHINKKAIEEDKKVIFYDPSNCLCPNNELKITPLEEIPDLEEFSSNVIRLILNMRSDINQSLLGICWALGRFHITEREYPILNVTGTTSIGKTKFMEFISRIDFGSKDNIRSFFTLTQNQIGRLACCSNITPLIIDEHKITADSTNKKDVQSLFQLIRTVYENGTITQGNIEKNLTKYVLKTPLIIGGESSYNDISVGNRCVKITLTQRNKCDDNTFYELANTKLFEALGKKAFENRAKKQIELSNAQIREALPSVRDERQFYTGRCLLTGLIALNDIIKLDNDTKLNFTRFLDKLLSETINPIKNFYELFKLAIHSSVNRRCYFDEVKVKGTNEIKYCINLDALYRIIDKERKATYDNHEFLSLETLKKQLLEEGAIEPHNATKFNLLKEENGKLLSAIDKKSSRCFRLKENAYLKNLIDEINSLDEDNQDTTSINFLDGATLDDDE